ncbi:hypothetical protein SALBM311S_02930 [Streptomyces alboniger]
MRCARRSRRPAAAAMASMVAITGKPSWTVIHGSSATSAGVNRRLAASGWPTGSATSRGSRSSVVTVTVRGHRGAWSRRWASTRSYSRVSRARGKSSWTTSSSARASAGCPGPARARSSSGKNAAPALLNAATDTSPSGRSTNSSTACRARASAVSTSTAAPASACPASVSTSPRPSRSVSGTGGSAGQPQLLGDRRRRHQQRLGDRGDTAQFAQLPQDPQLPFVHPLSLGALVDNQKIA